MAGKLTAEKVTGGPGWWVLRDGVAFATVLGPDAERMARQFAASVEAATRDYSWQLDLCDVAECGRLPSLRLRIRGPGATEGWMTYRRSRPARYCAACGPEVRIGFLRTTLAHGYSATATLVPLPGVN